MENDTERERRSILAMRLREEAAMFRGPHAEYNWGSLPDLLDEAADVIQAGSGVVQLPFVDGMYGPFPEELPEGVREFWAAGPVLPTASTILGGIPAYVGRGENQTPFKYENTSNW